MMNIFCLCRVTAMTGTDRTVVEGTVGMEGAAVDVKMVEKRLHEILTAVIRNNSGNWLQYFTDNYKKKYYQACKKAERESLEYPRIWWEESDDDPSQFVIKSVKAISEDEAYFEVVLKGNLLIGVFELILKREHGIWVIDEVKQKKLSVLSAWAQMDYQKDFLTIMEAMDIVSYRRYHPLTDGDMDDLIKSTARKYGYIEKGFLGGIGTCSFWQYVKGGHVLEGSYSEDEYYFIPDNIQTASTVIVSDCEGIESIDDDEVAIDIEMRVFSERNRNVLLGEMKNIGFRLKKSEDGTLTYTWQDYEISLRKWTSLGHDGWEFDVRLNYHKYDTTKHVEFKDSTRAHNLSIALDYPVKGNPAFLKRTRKFIMETLESDMMFYDLMARYSKDQNDGQAMVNYYGRKECANMDEYFYDQLADDPDFHFYCIEGVKIEVVGENDKYISFEVFNYRNCGGTSDYLVYGATFRKSDGKQLHVIANPQNPRFKHCLNEMYFEDRDVVDDEYKKQLPMPKCEPYLIQNGVRFTYQQGEIAVKPAGFIKSELTFSELRDFLTDEVKDVLK